MSGAARRSGWNPSATESLVELDSGMGGVFMRIFSGAANCSSILAALLLSTVLTAALVSAADMPTKAPVTVIANNWSGFYIGGNFGYGWN